MYRHISHSLPLSLNHDVIRHIMLFPPPPSTPALLLYIDRLLKKQSLLSKQQPEDGTGGNGIQDVPKISLQDT